MPIIPKDESTMLAEARRFIQQNSEFSNFRGDSLVWNVVEVPLRQLAEFWIRLSQADGQRFLQTATGEDLTNLGLMFGLARKAFQPAHTLSMSAGFKFYVPLGMTYSEAGGAGVATIPAGTTVWSGSDPRKIYRTTQEVSFSPTTREVFVPIIAEGSGTHYNVGPGQINRHSLTSLASLIYCTNLHSIDTGTDYEEDESYRYRLSQQIYRLQGASSLGIRAAALSIPGVRDVVVNEYARGTGTLDLVALTYTPQVSEDILSRVRAEVDRARPEGISVVVTGPLERAVNMVVKLVPDPTATLITLTTQSVVTYLNLLGLGESLIINEVIQQIMQVSTDILDLSISSLTVQDRYGRTIPTLRENQYCEPDEKFYAGLISIN